MKTYDARSGLAEALTVNDGIMASSHDYVSVMPNEVKAVSLLPPLRHDSSS